MGLKGEVGERDVSQRDTPNNVFILYHPFSGRFNTIYILPRDHVFDKKILRQDLLLEV